MSWDAFFWPHEVRVRALRQGAGSGPRLVPEDQAVPLVAEVLDSVRLVKTLDGREVVSSTRVTVPLDSDVPVGSEVTVWPNRANERTATVLTVEYQDNGDEDLDSQLVLSLE